MKKKPLTEEQKKEKQLLKLSKDYDSVVADYNIDVTGAPSSSYCPKRRADRPMIKTFYIFSLLVSMPAFTICSFLWIL